MRTFVDPNPQTLIEVTEEKHGDKFALKQVSNGKYYGVDSTGKRTEADGVGVDQECEKSDKGYVFTNDFQGKHQTFLAQAAQVKA